jgi:hypothetical protein
VLRDVAHGVLVEQFPGPINVACSLGQRWFSRIPNVGGRSSPPVALDLCVSLATDDIMLFSQGACPRARAAIRDIDNQVQKLGIEAHHGKDVNESTDCTLIGVELQDGRRLAPARDKLALVLVGLVHLLINSSIETTPLELQTILGHLAWFALLTRPVFSSLHEVYADARRDGSSKSRLRGECLAELTLFLMLLSFIDADLTRPWADIVVASDASPSYGFGVSVAPAAPDTLRSFARTAARKGAYVRLDRDGVYQEGQSVSASYLQGRFLHCRFFARDPCGPRWSS